MRYYHPSISFSKLSAFVFIFSFSFLFAFPANASCNIKSLSAQYVNDIYSYSTFGLSKPNLVVETGKLRQMSKSELSQYGVSKKSGKKYYIGAYTEGNTIGIYQKIFSSYKNCDVAAKRKLRAMITHEYVHHIDGSSYGLTRISRLIGTDNYEKAAIIGEHALSDLVWKKTITPTRKLTSQERKVDLATLRNYFISRKGN